jgi:hypothetical protein
MAMLQHRWVVVVVADNQITNLVVKIVEIMLWDDL